MNVDEIKLALGTLPLPDQLQLWEELNTRSGQSNISPHGQSDETLQPPNESQGNFSPIECTILNARASTPDDRFVPWDSTLIEIRSRLRLMSPL